MQIRARHKGRCLKCRTRIKPGDHAHYVPPERKGKQGKTFCRTCVAKLQLQRFPPAPDGKTSAWLTAQEVGMVERELAKTTFNPAAPIVRCRSTGGMSADPARSRASAE